MEKVRATEVKEEQRAILKIAFNLFIWFKFDFCVPFFFFFFFFLIFIYFWHCVDVLDSIKIPNFLNVCSYW